MIILTKVCESISAGKAFVEDVKLKTDEQLDEDVKLENEPKQV